MKETTTRFRCPILRCDWHYDRPPAAAPDALAAVFGPGTLAATSAFQQAHETEQAIEAHLNEHTVVEFVRTISKERQKATAWLVQIEVALRDDESTWLDVDAARRNVDEALDWFRAAMFGIDAAPSTREVRT